MARYAAEHLSSDRLTALQGDIDAFVENLAATADVHALSVYRGSVETSEHGRWHATLIWSKRTPIRPAGPSGLGATR
jgi:hypothetical protein